MKEISPNDGMFDPEYPERYFQAGDSALHCIRLAMGAVGKSSFDKILDFPCGHGRVLRALKAAFPEAGLTAADLDRDGVDFCSQTLGAKGVYSDQDLRKVDLEGGFDLIWVGSLFTHLPDALWFTFLDFFCDRLASGGLLVFTTHGRWPADRILAGKSPLAGSQEARRQMVRAYEATGFGFAAAGEHQAYGTSLTKPAAVLQRVEALEDVRLISFFEHGWAGFQDVVVCQKGFVAAR